MEFITGRVVIVGNNKNVTVKDRAFTSRVLVITKRMNKKKRNIAFMCYGKVSELVATLRKDDKVEITYFLSSNPASPSELEETKWYTTLIAKSVEKVVVEKKVNELQMKIN